MGDDMKQAVTINVVGIKCDSCDYRDKSVKYEEYKYYLNKPCPICGTNLLTKADLRTTKFIIFIAKIINKFIYPQSDESKIVEGEIIMNGTGKVDIKIKEKSDNNA